MTRPSPPVDLSGPETALRRRVDVLGGLGAFAYRRLGGTAIYTAGYRAVSMPAIEALDAPRRCETVALAVHEQFGFGVCFGWIAIGDSIETADLYGHYWNTNRIGRVIDAALARRRPLAYLGKALSEEELTVIGRMAWLNLLG